MTVAIVLIALVAFVALAVREAKLWQWALAALVIGVLTQVQLSPNFAIGGSTIGWVFALLPAGLFALASVPFIRRLAITGPIYGAVRSILPKVSRTEKEALEAGTVGWDAELFYGRPDWSKLSGIRKLTLTDEEQAFLDGPTEELCAMLDDWDIRHERGDLPPEVWQYLKEHGFLGMLISKEHGGLGFSAQAQSMVVSKIASRSVTAGITVMVPNSLGPGELLEKYGTDEQKAEYLEPLAKGKEVPCFALTGPHAGSDAAGMRDVGIVTKAKYKGKNVLGVRLSWDKRYITLAPVATLLGLAFHLEDPDNLLGKGEDIGITLALVPADFPGVEIGRRHFPARAAFMNGPTQGKDVFIPLDFLIGGTEYVGQGWRMLMECLSTGRAISLPAIGSVSIKAALRMTSAYARIRRQFGIPVGMMEGVAGPLSDIVKGAYMFEAGRQVTASMVDDGQKPAVISALLKYRSTDAMRDHMNAAMDIHGGRGVQDGPMNYLFAGYATTPVAITVEGANILTRSLITFAQGALRSHPYLYGEIEAAQMNDKRKGLKAFDKVFAGHTAFMLRNIFASFGHAITFGRFASAPSYADPEMAHWYRQLHRYAQNFALVGDWTAVFLGGALKRKQLISGRMADILSDLYLLSATLKRYEDEGRIEEDRDVVDAIARDRIKAIEVSFDEVFDNFSIRPVAHIMRFLTMPLGRWARGSSDRENYRLGRAILNPGEQRDRYTGGLYVNFDPADPTGLMEDALLKVHAAAEAESKFIRAVKKGIVRRRLDRDAIADAVEAEVLTAEEAEILRAADEATDIAIKVDDFEPGAFARDAKPAKTRQSRVKQAAE